MSKSVKCVRCERVFKVEKFIEWKFSQMCDNCILASQPYKRENVQHTREDAKIDFYEEQNT